MDRLFERRPRTHSPIKIARDALSALGVLAALQGGFLKPAYAQTPPTERQITLYGIRTTNPETPLEQNTFRSNTPDELMTAIIRTVPQQNLEQETPAPVADRRNDTNTEEIIVTGQVQSLAPQHQEFAPTNILSELGVTTFTNPDLEGRAFLTLNERREDTVQGANFHLFGSRQNESGWSLQTRIQADKNALQVVRRF